MEGIFTSAIAVLVMVALVALLWSNQVREKENYLTEGMCLGIALSAGLRSILDMELGLAISMGMLLGALVGQQIPKKKNTSQAGGETSQKEDDHEED